MPTTLASWPHAVGQAGRVTAAGLLLFTWQVVFAREISWSRILVGGWIGSLVVPGAAVVMTTRPDATRFESDLYWPSLLAQGSAHGLNAWASFRYQSMLRRRVRLGLGSPVVANRMLLWGLSSTPISLQYGYAVSTILLAHLGWAGLYQPGVIGALGLCAATCMTLAFFPPRSYPRRIERTAVSR